MENKRKDQEKKELEEYYRKFKFKFKNDTIKLQSMANKKHFYQSIKEDSHIQQRKFADSLHKITQSIYQNSYRKKMNAKTKPKTLTSYDEEYFINEENSLNLSLKNENDKIDEQLKNIQFKMNKSNLNLQKRLKNVSQRAHNLSLELDRKHSIEQKKNDDIKRRTVLEISLNKAMKAKENKEKRLTQTMFVKKIYNEEKSNKALEKFNEIQSKRMDMLLKKQMDAERRIQEWVKRKEEISFPKQKFKVFKSIQSDNIKRMKKIREHRRDETLKRIESYPHQLHFNSMKKIKFSPNSYNIRKDSVEKHKYKQKIPIISGRESTIEMKKNQMNLNQYSTIDIHDPSIMSRNYLFYHRSKYFSKRK